MIAYLFDRFRLGQSGDNLVVVPGMDTIDATGIDTDMLGHSYFAEAGPVIDDITAVVCRAAAPAPPARALTKTFFATGLYFWKFMKPEPTHL